MPNPWFHRATRVASMALLATMGPRAVHADSSPDKAACLAASNVGQDRRAEGKLLEARSQFATCAAASCPKVLRTECESWLADVEKALPTASFRVRTADGSDVVGCKVRDGAHTFDVLGNAAPLDPGKHVLTFTCEGHPSIERTIVLAEGEKLRVVDVVVDATPTLPPPIPHPPPLYVDSSPPTVAWVMASVAVVAFGSAAYFGITAKKRADDMRSTCKPRCPDDDVAAVDRKLLVADISLGIGAVATGVAIWLFARPKKEPSGVAPVALVGPSTAFFGLESRF